MRESARFLSMFDLLVADSVKETTVIEIEEKRSQETYGKLMADACETRTPTAGSFAPRTQQRQCGCRADGKFDSRGSDLEKG